MNKLLNFFRATKLLLKVFLFRIRLFIDPFYSYTFQVRGLTLIYVIWVWENTLCCFYGFLMIKRFLPRWLFTALIEWARDNCAIVLWYYFWTVRNFGLDWMYLYLFAIETFLLYVWIRALVWYLLFRIFSDAIFVRRLLTLCWFSKEQASFIWVIRWLINVLCILLIILDTFLSESLKDGFIWVILFLSTLLLNFLWTIQDYRTTFQD